MPTSSKLVAALLYAALGWFTADLVKPLLTEGTPVGLFSPISAGFGLLVGWVFVGTRIGAGQGGPVGIGLTGSILLVFWVVLTFSGYEMVRRSMRLSYDGPVEALQSMFELAVEYLYMAAVPEVIGSLVAGGIIAGWLTGAVARRWR
jgi:hypothetical protein